MADCYQTILSENGFSTKIMSFCFKLYSSYYLYNLFAPIFTKMFIADLHSYEGDSSRIEGHTLSLEEDLKVLNNALK